MIPRLRPPFRIGELLAAAFRRGRPDDEARFEARFAERFGFPQGLFFPYGRSALNTLLVALGWRDQEVLMPAYTCVVVAHAIALSGNQVRFVDSQPEHFLVSAEALQDRLSPQTRMVIPTPLFGYPVDRAGYREALRRRAPQALVVYDLAHGFGVEDEQGLQANEADAAIFGLGLGKQISTLYGGMLLLRDAHLAREVRRVRDTQFRPAGRWRGARLAAYGLAASWALREPFLTPVDWLERHTRLLHSVTEYYYGKGGPSLPDDLRTRPTRLQARLGLTQLAQYDAIVARRRELSARYERRLADRGFGLFAARFAPTFSHFPLCVAERDCVASALRLRGIQVGKLVDYACSDLPGYGASAGAHRWATWYGGHVLNLPNWPAMREAQVDRVVDTLSVIRDSRPEWFVASLAYARAA